jgi:hypothetical protein
VVRGGQHHLPRRLRGHRRGGLGELGQHGAPDIAKRYCDPADASKQKPLPIGTLITNPELAQTMKLVRDGGATAFYDPAQDTVKAIVQRTTLDSLPCKSILPNSARNLRTVEKLLTD